MRRVLVCLSTMLILAGCSSPPEPVARPAAPTSRSAVGGTRSSAATQVPSVTGVVAAGAGDAWIVAGPNLLQTADGGATWRSARPGGSSAMRSVALANADTGWAVGDARLFATTDAGATWTAWGDTSPPLRSLSFADAEHGLGISEDGGLVYSDDGGRAWRHASGVPGRVFDACLATAAVGWAVAAVPNGPDGNPRVSVDLTRDGGATWTGGPAVSTVIGARLARVPDGSAWALLLGAAGASQQSYAIYDLRPGDASVVVAAAVAVPTVGAGSAPEGDGVRAAAWAAPPAGRPLAISAARSGAAQVLFIGPCTSSTGVAGAISALCLSTTEGPGGAWRKDDVPLPLAGLNSYALAFGSADSGWIGLGIGDTCGAVLHTTDGGASWTPPGSGAGAEVGLPFALPAGPSCIILRAAHGCLAGTVSRGRAAHGHRPHGGGAGA